MNIPMGKSTLGELLPYFIVIAIMLLIVIFFICMLIITSQKKANYQKESRQLVSEGMLFRYPFAHMSGLPIASNMMCEIRSFRDYFEFKTDSLSMKLEKSKIADVSIGSESDIRTQYVSSLGGAVGGALLFGPVGAVIGGRAKKKTTVTKSTYLVFSYKKNEEFQLIVFNATGNFANAQKFVNEFKQSGKVTSINL